MVEEQQNQFDRLGRFTPDLGPMEQAHCRSSHPREGFCEVDLDIEHIKGSINESKE